MRVAALASSAIVSVLLWSPASYAIPVFAAQTGQPCTACHIGGYGPQLTPSGRAFKIGGYTQMGGDGVLSQIPLSAMLLSSFSNNNTSIPGDQVARHYAANSNFAVDQLSLFLGGRVNDYIGGLVQATYSPISNSGYLDNTDLRFTTTTDVHDTELRVGISVNNSPTVQDPYNTTFAWGFPYVSSALAPVQAAQPVLAGDFAGNSIGYTAYAWWDKSLYLEAGAYSTMSPWLLTRTGTNYGAGSSQGQMPYLRAAYEWDWNDQAAHVGGLFLQSNLNPSVADRATDGSNGRDSYTDFALDGSYAYLGDGTNIITTQGIFTHEIQNLSGSANSYNNANGTNVGAGYTLDQIRLTGSYWYQNTYGLTLGWQKTWGPANPILYQPGELTGSNNSKPNTNAYIVEADWVPFGKDDSWGAPLANLKLGAQLITYTQFNGGSTNYDGLGRSAAANNTLYLFSWLVF